MLLRCFLTLDGNEDYSSMLDIMDMYVRYLSKFESNIPI